MNARLAPACSALFAAMLAGCSPPPEPEISDELVAELSAVPPAPDSAGCGMRIETPWTDAGEGYRILADATGECAEAQLGLTIVGPGNGALAGIGYASRDIPQAFGDLSSREAVEASLRAWSDANAAGRPRHTGDLPLWPEGSDSPGDAVFGFTVRESFDPARYEALRAQNLPMFCHEAELNGLKCYVLEADSTVFLLGIRYPRS